MNTPYIPEHLTRWSPADPAFGGSDNYAGADLSQFWLAPIGISRDTADSVTLSNWRVIGAELAQLAQHEESGAHQFGHWACGWYESWLIHESDTAALECADRWAAALESYPIADESDLSELESEEEAEAWERWAMAEWRGLLVSALEPYAPDDAPTYWEDDVIDTLSDDALGEAWHNIADRLTWCCIHESDGPTFNFKEAREHLTADWLARLTGLPLLPPEQQWRREPYPWPDGSTEPLAPQLVESVQ